MDECWQSHKKHPKDFTSYSNTEKYKIYVQVLPTVPTRKVRFCSTEVERTVTGLKIMDALNYKHESILWDTFFSY